MQTIRTRRAAAALTVLASLAALPAWACTLQSTPQGPRVVDCNLGSFTQGRYDVDLSTRPADPRRRVLPNLVPQDLDFNVSGTQVDVFLTVRNAAGIAHAPAFEIGTLLWLANPLKGGDTVPGSLLYVPTQANPLQRNSSRVYAVRSLMLPDRTQDWDVCVSVVLDPSPSGGPAQGRVGESNEDDNLIEQCCRVYGPNTDGTGPAQCG